VVDGAALDVQWAALTAAEAVLERYWPEDTVPLDLELVATRMGIEVVRGRPEGDRSLQVLGPSWRPGVPCVTAVRDEHGARVVLAASLHPTVQSILLARAIGHLSRPAPSESPGDLDDAFARSFAAALRVPERALRSLRRDGLSWEEIDDRLGVERGGSMEQGRVHESLDALAGPLTGLTDPVPRALAVRVMLASGLPSMLGSATIADDLRRLETDLRDSLSGCATVRRISPEKDGPTGPHGDVEGVEIIPAAPGAEAFYWTHRIGEIHFAVGTYLWSYGFAPLKRSERSVEFLRSVVEAVVLGRVEIGRGDRVVMTRLTLPDGTVLSTKEPWRGPDGLPPIEWARASPYAERQGLLRQVADVTAAVVRRGPTTLRQTYARADDAPATVEPGLPTGQQTIERVIDAELTAALRAYAEAERDYERERFELRERPAASVADRFLAMVDAERAPELLARVEALAREARSVPDQQPIWTYPHQLRAWAATHPEVERDALSPIMSKLIFENR
jgi:hypothetical protein